MKGSTLGGFLMGLTFFPFPTAGPGPAFWRERSDRWWRGYYVGLSAAFLYAIGAIVALVAYA